MEEVLIGVLLFFYFLPTLIAVHREHRNRGAIVVLNLFLGWTLIGWVIALVWAVKYTPDSSAARQAR